MKLSDAFSLLGLALVVVLLLHAARHGPMEPVYDMLTGPSSPTVVEPGPVSAADAGDEPTSPSTVAGRLR